VAHYADVEKFTHSVTLITTGREALIRRFIEGGFRVHFGMQTQPSIVKHCATRT
jgi:hypothetical protein